MSCACAGEVPGVPVTNNDATSAALKPRPNDGTNDRTNDRTNDEKRAAVTLPLRRLVLPDVADVIDDRFILNSGRLVSLPWAVVNTWTLWGIAAGPRTRFPPIKQLLII